MNWLSYHFSASYLFNKNPETGGVLIIILTIYFILLIVIGLILAKIIKKRAAKITEYKVLREKILADFLAFGIIGLLLVFIRSQMIPFFSAPIIMLVFLLVNIIVFWYILMFYIKFSKPKVEKLSVEENYHRYLPKPKYKK